jgi:cation diffusion facilitator CzcD-associated flavoprotein CzcO
MDTGIAIVGAGFSGLAAAIRLRQEGRDDFVVLERHEEVGGTWWANTYPGCACDVPSHLYSLSFAPNPDWTRSFSSQPEILAYLRRLAREHDLLRSIRLSTPVESATWDDAARRWVLETSGGMVRARFLIAAQGPLAEPRLPDIPGRETFAGAAFHSAEWDHGHDLRGRRVAVIGTGASAIQFVPAIQPEAGSLHVFQRTAPWVMPRANRAISARERALYRRLPAAQKLARAGIYAGREALVAGLAKHPAVLGVVERAGHAHRRAQIADPELRRKVTPDFRIGCKRILPSDDWYPALQRPNVELVTDRIAEIRAHALVTADGVAREVDTIIYGTGFHVADMPVGEWVEGRGGLKLADAWAGSPKAYLGTATPGFPNLFLLLGPNTGLGHSSVVYMMESQLAYVLGALRAAGDGVVEVRPEAQAAFTAEMDRRMARTVWASGCTSWYQDATGRIPTIWPDWTWRFRRRTRAFEPEKFTLTPAPAAAEAVTA